MILVIINIYLAIYKAKEKCQNRASAFIDPLYAAGVLRFLTA